MKYEGHVTVPITCQTRTPIPARAGEEVVTRESFVSIAWRLVPYWMNQVGAGV